MIEETVIIFSLISLISLMSNTEQNCINLYTSWPNFESDLSIVSRNTASQEGHLKEGTCVGEGRVLCKDYHFIRILKKRSPVMM